MEELQKNWKMLLAEGAKVPLPGEPLQLPNDEWRKRLDKTQYHVLREEGTDIVVNSPQEFAAEVKAEFEKWRELVRKTGMKF